jgi:hypothetical protein
MRCNVVILSVREAEMRNHIEGLLVSVIVAGILELAYLAAPMS